jgi:hypothetical protein
VPLQAHRAASESYHCAMTRLGVRSRIPHPKANGKLSENYFRRFSGHTTCSRIGTTQRFSEIQHGKCNHARDPKLKCPCSVLDLNENHYAELRCRIWASASGVVTVQTFEPHPKRYAAASGEWDSFPCSSFESTAAERLVCLPDSTSPMRFRSRRVRSFSPKHRAGALQQLFY